MSWISDVKYELSKLELSTNSLRKFGLTIGLVFIVLSLFFIYIDTSFSLRILFIVFGSFLFILGAINPNLLKSIYKLWMTLAFVLGWFVSRLILTLLFFVVLTPIGLLAKIFNKKFLLVPKKSQKSYWIRKDTKQINYEKMY